MSVITLNPTVDLPQNLTVSAAPYTEGFETAGDWTPSGSGSIAANTSEKKAGSQSMKITTAASGSQDMYKTINWDLSSLSTAKARVDVWYYLHDTVPGNYSTLKIAFFNDAGMTQKLEFELLSVAVAQGWNFQSLTLDQFTASGGGTWANSLVRLRFRLGTSSGVINASLDALSAGAVGVPAIMFQFDDGYENQYTNCFQYMKQFRIPGTLYQIGTWIDDGSHITGAYLREMEANGWIIGNHTHDHTLLTSLSEAQQEAEITNGMADLAAKGLTKGGKHIAYPGGGSPVFDANTLTAMANTGAYTGRSSPVMTGWRWMPTYSLYNLEEQTIDDAVSLATAQGKVDTAISKGQVLTLIWHNVGGASNWSAATFQQFVDYVVGKMGLIYPITVDDYYRLTLGIVRVAGMV